MRDRALVRWTSFVAALVALPVVCLAQRTGAGQPLSFNQATATTGSVDEQTLLLLQLTGRAPMIQTSIRDFSARQLDTLTSFLHGSSYRRTHLSIAQPAVSLWYNGSRPSAEVEGVTWAGRGLTASISGGGVARFGPLVVALRPVAFWTENRPFRPDLGMVEDTVHFASPAYPLRIDLPYRFGNKSYARLDPGESFVQLDTRLLVGGLSTATQAWGPLHIYPLLLGPNAGGFPHVFLGTGLPWNIGIGRVSGRIAVGRLDASAFVSSHPGDERRLASEIVGVFTPAGLDGLEIGGGRFFHRRWPTNGIGLSVLRIPFVALLKDELANKDSPDAVADNQLASLFFRLARPKSGVELYGEFLRDDNSLDVNDFVGEPDHESAYALGLRRAWVSTATDGPLTSLTLEVVNGRISHLAELRGETAMYVHDPIVEGHTERGKLLGSPAAYGGTGYSLEFTRRRATGGWTGALRSESVAQNGEGGTWNGRPAGSTLVEMARIWTAGNMEYTLGATGQRAWNSLTGSNLGLSLVLRPVSGARSQRQE